MTSSDRFMGWPIRQLLLPNGDRVVCLYCKDGSEPDLSLHDANHNIFRLDSKGQVVWQIVRDEAGKFSWAWAEDYVREFYHHELRLPFSSLTVKDAAGVSQQRSCLEPGDRLYTSCEGVLPWQVLEYEIDIDRGVARCVYASHRKE